jgi:hypothetical protein
MVHINSWFLATAGEDRAAASAALLVNQLEIKIELFVSMNEIKSVILLFHYRPMRSYWVIGIKMTLGQAVRPANR